MLARNAFVVSFVLAVMTPALAQEVADPAPGGSDVHLDMRGWSKGPRHKDDRVTVGGSVIVKPGESVGDAVAVGGNVTVQGHVRGDAVAVAGTLTLEPGARVDGDAVVVGGELWVAEGAQIQGNRVHIGGGLGGLIQSAVRAATNLEDAIPWAILATVVWVVRLILFIVLALLVVAFAPRQVERIGRAFVETPLACLGAGVALVLLSVPMVVLLAVTIIGLPLVPVALLVIVGAFVVGLTAACVWLGYRLPLFQEGKGPFRALVLGMAVMMALELVPVLGGLVVFVASLLGAGAAVLTRFGTRLGPPQPAAADLPPLPPPASAG